MKILFYLFLLLSGPFAFCQNAPDFTFIDTQGNSHSLHQSLDEGKIILIDFFYVDCPPCVDTGMELQQIHEDYAGTNLEIWSISPFDTNSYIDSFQLENGFNYIVGGVEGNGLEIAELYSDSLGLEYFPTISVVCPDGNFTWDIWPYTAGGAPEWRGAIESCGVSTISTAVANLTNSGLINLYPNPATDYIRLEVENFTFSNFLSLEIYNLQGVVVKKEQFDLQNISSILEINTHNLPVGNYFLKVNDSKQDYQSRLFSIIR